MADRPTISTLASGIYDVATLNTNFQNIRDAFDLLLGLNGVSGSNNTITGDVDFAGKTLRNAVFDGDIAGFDWKNNWLTATAYIVNDVVVESNKIYICVVAHTSGTFSTDLAAVKWQIMIDGTASTDVSAKVSSADTTTSFLDTKISTTSAITTTITSPGGDERLEFDVADNGITTDHLSHGTQGDVLYYGASGAPALLGQSTSGNVLTTKGSGADPVWENRAPILRGYIDGFKLTNAADTDHDIVFGAGLTADSLSAEYISNSSNMTKQIDATWAAGDAAGGLFSGTVANTTWYHCFTIVKDSDGSVDHGFDTSVTAANIPSGYTAFRRVLSVLTNGSANILPFLHIGNYVFWDVPVTDLSAGAIAAAGTTLTLTVPTGVRNIALINAQQDGSRSALFYPTDQTGAQPSITAAPVGQSGINVAGQISDYLQVLTDTSSQIIGKANSDQTAADISTLGWIDFRGQN